jgi:antirestriction protein ArdC
MRKGSQSTIVIFWKSSYTKTVTLSDDAKEKIRATGQDAPDTADLQMPVLRFYRVFNATQVEGIEDHPALQALKVEPQIEFEPLAACARIAASMPNAPRLTHNEQRAYYSPHDDLVNMPEPETFKGSEEYYATLFHELTHSTGHRSRLFRSSFDAGKIAAFGSNEYGEEELTAEMGASFLCGESGISPATIDNAAAYINGWMHKIKGDPKLVIIAAARAQKAADYILDREVEA